jgi:hypothetical protein
VENGDVMFPFLVILEHFPVVAFEALVDFETSGIKVLIHFGGRAGVNQILVSEVFLTM